MGARDGVSLTLRGLMLNRQPSPQPLWQGAARFMWGATCNSCATSELNPDELVWRHLKTHNLGRSSLTGPHDLKQRALPVLRRLQKVPALIKAFFLAPNVRYALA